MSLKRHTLDELAAEMKQGRYPSPQMWAEAREYERSLLPAHVLWPVEGDRFECCTECSVPFSTHWHVAFTGGGEGNLVKGDIVRVQQLDEPQPLFIPARPEDYALVQRRVVAPTDVNHPNYAGFSFSLHMRVLLEKFRRIT